MKDEPINIVFSSFEIYQTLIEAQHLLPEIEDNIPSEEFESFRNNIKNIIDKIKSSDIPDNDKNIFLSIFSDLDRAISLYKINGLNAFIEVIRNNLCKISMINNLDEDNDEINKFKIITKKTIGQIWIWSISYMKKKVFAILESKVFEYLEENAFDWAQLPIPEINQDSDDIEADIEE